LESDWAVDKPHLMFNKDGVPSGNSNTPTDGAVVKEPYTDVSTCYVKFLRDGFDLYISLNSDDQQVCRFDWEGDGMFMKIWDAASANEYEIKNYVGASATFVFETNAPAGVTEGVGYPMPGTTIYDSSDVDNGYTAETVIHLDQLGFVDPLATVRLMINIFEPDNYSAGVPPWGPNGNFYKQWWGSEWGGTYRDLVMLDEVVPVELSSFAAVPVDGNIQLKWTTASEINNSGFEIQRNNTDQEFAAIGFVEGNGTTTERSDYSYVDNSVTEGVSYSYRLKQIDFDGSFEYSNVVNVETIALSDFSLEQNYPNPFNPSTSINFNLPFKANVNLAVYNLLGQKVLIIAQGEFESGRQVLNLNASDLSSGIYIYTLTAIALNGDKFVASKKMTLLK
jgi:hypothetical protein